MSIRQKISDLFSPFNSNRFLLIILTILMIILIGLIVNFFFLGKIRQKDKFDPITLCLYGGSTNGVMVFIDQTAGLTKKQAKGIERRVRKIAGDQVDQFGRMTFYIMTRDNQTKKIGFVCSPGNVNNIEDSWVDILGMRKKRIFDYYKSQVSVLSKKATNSMVDKPDATYSKMMEGLRDAIVLYKNPTKIKNDNQAKTLPDHTSLDWLIIFSDMLEHRPDFSLRNATAKTTPTIINFWEKNASLKLELDDVTVGIYYFKDKKIKKNNTTKNNKKLPIKRKRNSKFKKFWHNYWQSQGASVEWFRGME
ncbi:MAG: hypothetical protein ACR2NY_00030 [Alphaproteobacteria bacterium]